MTREEAIETLKANYPDACYEQLREAVDIAISALRTQNVPDRNVGEWDMFELITSVWYGKQCYFVEENGVVYSRVSGKYMSVDEAIKEFLGRIGDNE